MTRLDYIRQYLFTLVLQYEALEAERQKLLAAATRITEIQAEKQSLLADAQDALVKFNAVGNTSYTLQQVRSWYDNRVGMINVPETTTP